MPDQQKAVLITGGSRGIGLSFAQMLLEHGHQVAITGVRRTETLAQVTGALQQRFGVRRVAGVRADAGVAVEADRAVDVVLQQFGRLDVLVNNAARGPREISETFTTKPPKFWEIPAVAWQQTISSNVNGPFFMSRAAAPHMIDQGWGRIVNISTSRVTMVRKGYAPYGPSKTALDAMTRIFAQDLEGTGVTVNALLPGGATDTEFVPGDGPGRRGADGKLLAPDVMNAALLWLISDASDGVTAARFVGARWISGDESHRAREDSGAPPAIL
jgi:NAD(P)-dependent dehydrogenase (short-subunit alcohol dehydrogenase family)